MGAKSPLVLDYNELIKYFVYDYTSGIIWRKINASNVKAGTRADKPRKDKYSTIRFNKKKVSAARVAWTMFTGKNPNGEIDHIDGNPSNNKIENLRDVTKSQNAMNKKQSWGVSRCTDCKVERYAARIKVNGKDINLGRYDTEAEAREAYLAGLEEYHGEYRRRI